MLFVYSTAIFLMSAHNAVAQRCATVNESCNNDGFTNFISNRFPNPGDKIPLSFIFPCCSGLECGELGLCIESPDEKHCIEENQSCRLQKCCAGLECGEFGLCIKPPEKHCMEEDQSCRLKKCCPGLECGALGCGQRPNRGVSVQMPKENVPSMGLM
ncbi:unnamed protein product [Amaranthus hypochondriacus]